MADMKATEPDAWDLVVPFPLWATIAARIPQSATPTRFGGWRFSENGVQIDIFPADILTLMQYPFVGALWHPKTNALWTRTQLFRD
jgi:hypothetical protein